MVTDRNSRKVYARSGCTALSFLSIETSRGVHFDTSRNFCNHYSDNIETLNQKTTEICLHRVGDSEREAMRVLEKVTQKLHTFLHTKPVE